MRLNHQSHERDSRPRFAKRATLFIATIAVAGLVVAACSTGSADTISTNGNQPAPTTNAPAQVDAPEMEMAGAKTIKITMTEMAFTPETVNVKAGETVIFDIVNDGKIRHELVIGDEHAQDEAEQAMQAMQSESTGHSDGGHGDEEGVAMSITLGPGESGQLTYTAGAPGTLLIGCHEIGHYGAGMVGQLTIT